MGNYRSTITCQSLLVVSVFGEETIDLAMQPDWLGRDGRNRSNGVNVALAAMRTYFAVLEMEQARA
jgi:hypothetical protein